MPNNIARQVLGVNINEQDPRPYYINVTNKQLIEYDDALSQVIGNNQNAAKVYKAGLYQVGTSSPQALVYENTIDAAATFTSAGTGIYEITFPTIPVFNGAKIFTPGPGNYFGKGNGHGVIYNFDLSKIFYWTIYPSLAGSSIPQSYWEANKMKIEVLDDTFSYVDLSTALGTLVSNIPNGTLNIEIQMYP